MSHLHLPTAISLLLHTKGKHRLRVHRLSRLQLRARKARMVGRIGEVLRLQAEPGMLAVRRPGRPMQGAIQEVP